MNKAARELFLAVVFTIGCTGSLWLGTTIKTRPASSNVTELTDRQLQVDLMFYQRNLQKPGYTGCKMSIDDFRKYHALNDERKRRAVE